MINLLFIILIILWCDSLRTHTINTSLSLKLYYTLTHTYYTRYTVQIYNEITLLIITYTFLMNFFLLLP